MSADGVSLVWLGQLLGTEVVAAQSMRTDAFNSTTARLEVAYADRNVDLPTRLVLKRNLEDAWGIAAGREEAAFYALADSLDPRPPGVPPCLAAGVDPDSGNSFVLMPDLSDTHAPPLTRDQQVGLVDSVPASADLSACLIGLARHHAYWWDHPALRSRRFEIGLWSRDADRVAAYAEQCRGSWARVDRDRLPGATVTLIETVLDGVERHGNAMLVPRFRSWRDLTLAHGDAYFTNFLCPRSGPGTTYLLDWQGPQVDHCGIDLANLLATFWTREQRQAGAREIDSLRGYHQALVEEGVVGYAWDDLVTDYRCGLLDWLLVPVQDAADGSDPSYWMPKLRCLEAAVLDWDCLALIA